METNHALVTVGIFIIGVIILSVGSYFILLYRTRTGTVRDLRLINDNGFNKTLFSLYKGSKLIYCCGIYNTDHGINPGDEVNVQPTGDFIYIEVKHKSASIKGKRSSVIKIITKYHEVNPIVILVPHSAKNSIPRSEGNPDG
jgi:hypothetical protein